LCEKLHFSLASLLLYRVYNKNTGREGGTSPQPLGGGRVNPMSDVYLSVFAGVFGVLTFVFFAAAYLSEVPEAPSEGVLENPRCLLCGALACCCFGSFVALMFCLTLINH
ncbi:hypothetical protein, partial [Gluconacetobacter entanii]